jgi:hypothetical protein
MRISWKSERDGPGIKSSYFYITGGACGAELHVSIRSMPAYSAIPSMYCQYPFRKYLEYPGQIPECPSCLTQVCSDLKSKRVEPIGKSLED